MGRSKLQGNFSDLLPQMRWFQCRFILEAKNLVLSNLVILDLSHSDVDENWDGWSQIQVLEKLKILDLSWCQRLGKRPVFTENMALQRLELRLEKLERLNLEKCKSLGNLPQSLGNLQSLVNLNVEYTKIIRLPPSIGRLEKLQSMNL